MGTPLRIGILTFNIHRSRSSIDDLMIKHAALARGHTVKIYFAKHFQYTFNNHRPHLLYKSRQFAPPDIMLVRPNILSDVEVQLSIVKQLSLLGVPVINNSLPIVRAKNKIRTLQMLSHAQLPVPRTVVVNNIQYLDKAIEQVGSFPVIMKLAQGSYGSGVSILESRRSLRSMLDLVIASSTTKNSLILIQEYVKEAKGKDIRVFIVGGVIIAAMERKARRGEFRANFQLGGSVALADLSEEERRIALEAVHVLGLDIAGVDIIRTVQGPKILEVNSNPGIEGITAATNINIADRIVEFIERRARIGHREESLVMSG